MQNKETLVLEKLKNSKDKGVLISDLFNEFESDGSIKTTLYRLRQSLGNKDVIQVKNNRWFLMETIYSLTKDEFKDFLRNAFWTIRMQAIIEKEGKTVVRVTIAMCLLCIIIAGLGYFVGLYDGVQTTEEFLNDNPQIECQS